MKQTYELMPLDPICVFQVAVPTVGGSGNVEFIVLAGVIPSLTETAIRGIGKRKWVWGPERLGLNPNSISL